MSDLRARYDALEDEIAKVRRDTLNPLYRERDALAVELAEAEQYTVPRPSRRTDKQALVARCPRCSQRLEADSGRGLRQP